MVEVVYQINAKICTVTYNKKLLSANLYSNNKNKF